MQVGLHAATLTGREAHPGPSPSPLRETPTQGPDLLKVETSVEVKVSIEFKFQV